jgi:ribulose-5-phosphate 4-epimerase/fuculose-1-phosphate aldolase
VANHFSLAVSPDGKTFLMNPKWKHFSLIRASDLLLLDSTDPETMKRADAPDASA